MMLKTVTVLGANGTMGINVSGIFASFGNAKVYMMCRKLEEAEKAKTAAAQTVRAGVIEKNLIPVTYDDIDNIIPLSDIVFESVAENIDVKKDITQKVIQYLRKDSLLCTGTSGLSIDELSKEMPSEIAERYLGMHFFNPPYSMTLCELIPSRYVNESCLEEIKKYLQCVLYRTVVVVQDKPAFLGNRIGFFFINEAVQYAERYQEEGGIDYIDSILGGVTGRNMAPLATADFVGLDVHKAIVDNIFQNAKDLSERSFLIPEYVERLIEKKCLGRKTGQGLYKIVKTEENKKKIYVYDIVNDTYREKRQYKITFVEEMLENLKIGNYEMAMEVLAEADTKEGNIARDFLIRYTVYSLKLAKEIGEDFYSADSVMATGFNWIPPLATISAFGGKQKFLDILDKADLNNLKITMQEIKQIILETPISTYDYRCFLKAKR